jgi:hypothetical protein
MTSELPLLVRVLNKQLAIANLSLKQWDLLIRQARSTMLLAKLYYLVEEQGMLANLSLPIIRHLQSAKVHSDKQLNDLFWEARNLKKVAKQLNFPLIFLKGAAYAISGSLAAKGRIFSDLDLLVPIDKISITEKQLMLNGWVGVSQTAYDQRYYRRWMHEVPPLKHMIRGSVIDLHHNILPVTCADCPDANLLIEHTEPVLGHEGLEVLEPCDQVIHSATHLFYDGEFEHGLRDLVDLDALIRALDHDQHKLIDRALQLGLQRPVLYALRYSSKILLTPGATELAEKINKAVPTNPRFLMMMDFLFMRALMPIHPSCHDRWSGFARWLLYLRAHWLKMPLYLLIPHLSRKAWMRLIGKEQH